MRLARAIRWLAFAVGPIVVVLAIAGAGAGAARAAAPTWQLEQPPAAGGGPGAALGAPAALEFFAPNRGLLETGGSGGNPAGIWTYNGQSWTLLADVCGADISGEYGGIAFAGRDDFWTISQPAPNPLATTTSALPGMLADNGTTLCHFQNGRVVASYAVPQTAAETYLPMRAAACISASDCWFGGDAGATADGLFKGTFHLHWDGSTLSEVWSPQDRAVSSMTAFDGSITQTSVLGPQPYHEQAAAPVPADGDTNAPLVQVLTNGQFANDPYLTPAGALTSFLPTPQTTWNQVDVEDAQSSPDGSALWVSGGPAHSGGTYGDNAQFDGWFSNHFPFLAVRSGAGPLVPLTFSTADQNSLMANPNNASTSAQTTFTSVAPIPGSPDEAWVGIEKLASGVPGTASLDARYTADNARLAEIQYDPTAPAGQPNATVVQLVTPADEVGDVRRLQCPAANDCWAATTDGFLLHWTDGTQQPVDNDPAYSQLISIRPPDGRSPQPVSVGDPFDDSDLFEPQPLPPAVAPAAPPPPAAPVTKTKHIGVLIRDPRSRALGQRRLEVSFELMRPARVGLAGFLHGRQVARTAERKLIPGDQRLFLKVRPHFRPLQLKFLIKELALGAPTLATGAHRSGSRGVAVTLKAPGTGRLTVRFRRNVGDRGTGAAITRHASVGGTHKLTKSVALPAGLARGALMVRFAVTSSPRQSGVPKKLMSQRLLAALPSAKPAKPAGRAKTDRDTAR